MLQNSLGFAAIFCLEEVAIVEPWLGCYCCRLQVLIVIDGRVVEVSMIVKIRLLEVYASLLL
jgi:hypothetical protein